MRILTPFIVLAHLFSLVAPTYAEELVEGIAAIVTIKSRSPIEELVFFTDIARYRLFFEPELEKSEGADPLTAVIQQRLFRPEAHRFILDAPPPEAVEARLKVIRKRFEDDVSFQNALLQTGLNLDELKMEIREYLWVKELLDERIKEFIFISPKAIETYYNEHPDRFKGKERAEVETRIEAILTMKKEASKKAEYLQRLKKNAEIKILLNERDGTKIDKEGRPE